MSLDADGLTIQTLEEIQADIEADLKAELGPTLNTTATSVVGQIIGVFADRLAELEELVLAVHRSQYPDSASGEALDNVAAITGATRLAATKSSFSAENAPANALTLNLNAGVTVPAGSIVRVPSGPRFILTEDAVNSGGAPADIDAEAEAEETGPTVANADTVTEIVTPVSGWNSVNNDVDAEVGRDVETDADFRLRREQLLRATGAGTVDAIRADVLAVDDVEECYVFENTTLVADGDGVPGKAFEVVATGGEDEEIAQAIWDAKPAGIETHGSTTESVTDSQGFAHDVKFSRPTLKTVHVIVDVTTDPDTYPADGAAQIKAKVVEYGETLGIGDDVIVAAIYPYVFDVSGVLDIVSVKVGFTDPPTLSVNLAIATRELASLDTANVDVT